MNGVVSCALRTSHPSISCMALERPLSEGRSLTGCVCGMIYCDSRDEKLAVEGTTGALFKLTALCCRPDALLAGDRLTCGEDVFIIRSVSPASGIQSAGVVSAIVEAESPSGNGGGA